MKSQLRDNLIYLGIALVVASAIGYVELFNPGFLSHLKDRSVQESYSLSLAIAAMFGMSIARWRTELRKARFWVILLSMVGAYGVLQWQLVFALHKPTTSLLLFAPEALVFLAAMEFMLRAHRSS